MHQQELFTVGHGVKAAGELIATLQSAGCETLVDVRRLPFSRRNPQFNQGKLKEALAQARMRTPEWQSALGRTECALGGQDNRSSTWSGARQREPHRLYHGSEAGDGCLFLCGQAVG